MSRIQNDEVQIHRTRARQTPRTGSDAFREALADGAGQLLAGVEQVAGLVPGGSALSAAIRSSRQGSSGAGGGGSISLASTAGGGTAPEGPGSGGAAPSDPASMLQSDMSRAEDLLLVQQQMAAHSQHFQTLSNILKAKHDTAKAVIGNIR